MQDSDNYIEHPLNISPSKKTFTFAKTKRFLDRKTINSCIYNVPEMKSRITCTLGYGKKIQLADRKVSPPPGTYNPTYPNDNHQKLSISFGLSRQSVKFGDFMQTSNRVRKNPSPLHYQIKNSSSLQKRSGLISKKLPTQFQLAERKNYPGPGSYNGLDKTDLSHSGSFFLSKFKNCSIPRYQSVDQRSKRRERIKTVGPCDYTNIDEFGRSLSSRYKNSIKASFSKSERPGPEIASNKYVPSFKYKRFSEFGNKV